MLFMVKFIRKKNTTIQSCFSIMYSIVLILYIIKRNQHLVRKIKDIIIAWLL